MNKLKKLTLIITLIYKPFFMTFFAIILFFTTYCYIESKEDIENFLVFNMDVEQNIKEVRFFCIAGNHSILVHDAGFLAPYVAGSPLYDRIPEQVGMPAGPPGMGSKTAVILQTIPTKYLKKKRVQGGFCGGKNVFYLVIDNSYDEDLLFQLDDYKPITMPSRSQKTVQFLEGTHAIKILKSTTEEVFEFHKLYTRKYSDGCYYVYNIGGRNNYKIVHVSYR